MKKVNVEVNKIGYPMPVVIIGTEVKGKANFMTAAWVTNVNLEPPMLAICLSKDHLTSKAIQENKAFVCNTYYSVNRNYLEHFLYDRSYELIKPVLKEKNLN